MSELLNRYGARIKSIYLELKNYAYYHNPSEISNPDKRFIGRREVKKKLKNLLTRSDTHSGTYLVTGFRGMGKTSLVNQVISEIKSTENVNRYVKLIFSSLLVAWLSTFFHYRFIIGISLLVIFMLLKALAEGEKKWHFGQNTHSVSRSLALYKRLFTDAILCRKFDTNTQYENKFRLANKLICIFTLLLISYGLYFLFTEILFTGFFEEDPSRKFIAKFYIIFLVFLIHLFVVIPAGTHKGFRDQLGTLWKNIFSMFFVFLLFIVVLNVVLRLNVVLTVLIGGVLIYLYLVRDYIKKIIHNYINYNEIIPIRINLGKENLTEEDVLRLIVFSLKNEYAHIKKKFSYFKRTVWSLFVAGTVYFFGLILYYQTPIYDLFKEWGKTYRIEQYFPSQKMHYNESFAPGQNPYHYFKTRLEAVDSIDKGIHNRFEAYQLAFLGPEAHANPLTWQKKITFTLDYIYQSLIFYVTKPINAVLDMLEKQNQGHVPVFSELLTGKKQSQAHFHILPLHDYYFIIYFLILVILARWIIRLKIWGPNHREIYRKLEDLTENINAAILEEQHAGLQINPSVEGQGFKSLKFFDLFKKVNKTKGIPIAGAREIELALLGILDDIEKIPPLRMRPRLVFILDELDKIQPKSEIEEKTKAAREYLETEWIKRRQDTIREILTNLKHFFNTSKAKFIFIAGREMYDAALADISDRDALIGSMFHEVIYVHSFYKDPADERLSDITSMTERYICNFLIPPSYLQKKSSGDKKIHPDLRQYNLYLKDSYPDLSGEERAKIIITLQDFITYVSYRSNGAPKKITQIFEEYITSFPETKISYDSTIVTKGDKRNLYLHFSYTDQYIFTVGKYLFNPFVIAVNKYINLFEDKLLVSTSFLLNHLYKYHKVGFSYKSLELTPEIIAIYKAPELRDFIMRIINFIQKTHIRKIISGLYDFKFSSKVEREISFVSKISEKESAALNFTLDESLVIKSIFRSYLKKFKRYWKSKRELKEPIEVLLNIYANLGDLNFNDNQYLEAIRYYEAGLVAFKNRYYLGEKNKDENLSPDTFITYIQMYLKYALSYEMIKNYDKALLAYENIYHKTMRYLKSCKHEWEKKNQEKKHTPIITIQRIFYQSLLAKLQIIEKSTIKSLTKNQLNTNINQFKQRLVDKYLKTEQSFLLRTEYYNKLGDLLFYKNGIVFGRPEDSFIKGDLSKLKKLQKTSDKKHLYALPISGYEFYMISIAALINAGVDEKLLYPLYYYRREYPELSEKYIVHRLTEFLFRKTDKDFPLTRRSFYLATANALSDAGDAILIFASAEIDSDLKLNKDLSSLLNVKKLKQIFRLDYGNKYDYSGESIENSFNNRESDLDLDLELLVLMVNELLYTKECLTTECFHPDFPFISRTFNLIDNTLTHRYAHNISDVSCDTLKIEIEEISGIYKKLNEYYSQLKERKEKSDNNFGKILRKLLKKTKRYLALYENLYLECLIKQLESTKKGIFDLESRFHVALRYFMVSAAYFMKAGEYKEYAFQLTKVLHVLKVFIPVLKKSRKDYFDENSAKELLQFLREDILEKIIRFTFKAYQNHESYEVQRIIKALQNGDDTGLYKWVYFTTAVSEDVKEVILLYKEIELLLLEFIDKDNLSVQNPLVRTTNPTSLEYNRLHEMNYKNHYNFHLLKQLLPEYLKQDIYTNFLSPQKAEEIISEIMKDRSNFTQLEFILLDSLFTLFNMHRSIHIFGLSYIHNNSWYASIYKRIGFWSTLYHEFEKQTQNIILQDPDELSSREKLTKLIGEVEMEDLHPLAYYEKALDASYKIYESHFEGNTYYQLIENMHYLDDDFNDSITHFAATMERVVINLGIIERNIEEIKKGINNSADKYFSKFLPEYSS